MLTCGCCTTEATADNDRPVAPIAEEEAALSVLDSLSFEEGVEAVTAAGMAGGHWNVVEVVTVVEAEAAKVVVVAEAVAVVMTFEFAEAGEWMAEEEQQEVLGEGGLRQDSLLGVASMRSSLMESIALTSMSPSWWSLGDELVVTSFRPLVEESGDDEELRFMLLQMGGTSVAEAII